MNRFARAGLAFLLVTALTGAAWAGWLGWDQQYDELPNGEVSGPYQPWQVIGLVLTIGAVLLLACWKLSGTGAAVGTTVGLAVSSFYDWSDDDSGLFIVGVGMITIGALFISSVVALITAALTREPVR